MSGQQLPEQVNHTVGNSQGLDRLPSPAGLSRRDVGLRIRPFGTGFDVHLFGAAFEPPNDLTAQIPLEPKHVFGHVHRCRQAWMAQVVSAPAARRARGGGQEPFYPCQDSWDLKRQPSWIEKA